MIYNRKRRGVGLLVSEQHVGIDELEHHEVDCFVTKASTSLSKQGGTANYETTEASVCVLSLTYLASFRTSIPEESEESLRSLVKAVFISKFSLERSIGSFERESAPALPCPTLSSLHLFVCAASPSR
jgi:hypothetical protein